MSEEKKCCSSKAVIILLVINTLLLAGIFLKLCCLSSKAGFCPLGKKGPGMCLFSQKGSSKGSSSVDDMQQKDSSMQQ